MQSCRRAVKPSPQASPRGKGRKFSRRFMRGYTRITKGENKCSEDECGLVVGRARRLCRSTVRKASPFRHGLINWFEAVPRTRGGAAAKIEMKRDGKPEAYRSVLRHSRAECSRLCKAIVCFADLIEPFLTVGLLPLLRYSGFAFNFRRCLLRRLVLGGICFILRRAGFR